MNYIEEETILSPYETRFTIDGWLQDTKHLTEPNRDGVYSLSFTATCSQVNGVPRGYNTYGGPSPRSMGVVRGFPMPFGVIYEFNETEIR